jgi:Putative Ig domain
VNSANFTQGKAETFTVMATGSPSPTFSETGALPSGITLSSAGVLSGSTTQSGTFPVTITATNGVSPDATQSFTLTVTQLFQIWTPSLPNATPGKAYGPVQLQEIGQTSGATLEWKKAGTLPHVLKVVGGFLEGTPSLKLVHRANLSVPVEVIEKWVTISGSVKAKHLATVTKTLTLHIN